MLCVYLYLNLVYIHTLCCSVWCGKTNACITPLPVTKLFFFSPVIYNLFTFLLGSAEQCHIVYSCNLSFPLFFLFWIHTFNSFLPQLHLLTDKWSISSSSLYLDIFPCYSMDSSGNLWIVQIFTYFYMLTYTYWHIINAGSVLCSRSLRMPIYALFMLSAAGSMLFS